MLHCPLLSLAGVSQGPGRQALSHARRRRKHHITKAGNLIFVKKNKRFILLTLFCLVLASVLLADVVERFPKPDFKSDYTYPEVHAPDPRSTALEYLDLFVLVVALSLASWFALKLRSRKYILILMIFALAYFGFYREGCVCPIGAIQNVALALFDSSYSIPLTVLGFFAIPLVFTLYFGRTFCAAVCPLGAVQDIVILKPLRVPAWLEIPLRLIPYLYLGLAVLFAATGAGFIICQYDPFVGFFRFGATFNMIIFGFFLLLLGTVVARPYCRYLCPLGVLLNWFSRLSRKHVNITPSECTNCRLCEESCPVEAINKPDTESEPIDDKKHLRQLMISFALLPLLVIGGGWVISQLHIPLSKQHFSVSLAEEIQLEDSGKRLETTLETRTFRASGQTTEDLIREARIIQNKFQTGGWILGGFLGLVFGLQVIQLTRRKQHREYHADTGRCVSCGRCFAYCPFEQIRRDPSKRESILDEI